MTFINVRWIRRFLLSLNKSDMYESDLREAQMYNIVHECYTYGIKFNTRLLWTISQRGNYFELYNIQTNMIVTRDGLGKLRTRYLY